MSETPKPAKGTTFTDDEKAAMKERAKEQKAEARRGAARADGEKNVLAKIAEMPDSDRAMAAADKFKYRYATFGFNEDANLDEGSMWPTAFALTELTAADEARIGALVKKAVS